MTHSLEQKTDLWQQKYLRIRDVLFATQRNVRPNLLLVSCCLQLGAETFKSQTTGGSVMSDHVQIPLSSSWWPCHCASLSPGWSCVSGPRPAELTPCLGLARLLSVNICHPRSVFWLPWHHQESDHTLAPGKYFSVNASGSGNSPCCPVAQGSSLIQNVVGPV